MDGLWLQDLECLEAISQDDDTRRLFLRIARMREMGRLQPFLHELDADGDLDAQTKEAVAELAQDEGFLRAVEEYVYHTRALH
jgi:hypothetical protein